MTNNNKVINFTKTEGSNCPILRQQALSAICNWHNPALVVGNAGRKGLGVFTSMLVKKDDLLIVFGGRVLSTSQLALLPDHLDMAIQIEEEHFYVPVDLDNLGVAERINHSCNPNAGFNNQISVVAMRDIKAGEEISIDYATCDARPEIKLKCQCGAGNCRKYITGNDWLLPEVQGELISYYQPFLQRRIASMSKRIAYNS